jgi:hypothetical protein
VILAGVALGVAFLLRYDVVWIAAVMAFAFYARARDRGDGAERIDRAQATSFAFSVPVLFVVGLWTITAWFAHGDVTQFLGDASDLSALAANDPTIAASMDIMRGEALEVARWLAPWLASFGLLSMLAVVGLVIQGAVRNDMDSLILAAVLSSTLLPPVISVLTGHGQPHVTHLFVLVVPAFVTLAYLERRRREGLRPAPYERRAIRRQFTTCSLLFLASMATAVVFPWLPQSDPPAPLLIHRLRVGGAEPMPEDVRSTVAWIKEHAGDGDVLVDPERCAAVMLALNHFDRFRTPTDTGGLAAVADPVGISNFVLLRRPVAGAEPGPIERAHRNLYAGNEPGSELVFEAGDYRIYRVSTPPPEDTQR